MQTTDLRVRRTLNNIRDAFMQVVVEAGFDQITVQAIAERAVINRATFYRYYTDKFDLAEKLSAELVSFETQIGANIQEHMRHVFAYIAENAAFFRAALSNEGIPYFRERIFSEIENGLSAQLDELGFDAGQAKLPVEFPIAYMTAAQVGFTKWWLEQGMPYPPETAADLLYTLHMRGALWALGVQGGSPS